MISHIWNIKTQMNIYTKMETDSQTQKTNIVNKGEVWGRHKLTDANC